MQSIAGPDATSLYVEKKICFRLVCFAISSIGNLAFPLPGNEEELRQHFMVHIHNNTYFYSCMYSHAYAYTFTRMYKLKSLCIYIHIYTHIHTHYWVHLTVILSNVRHGVSNHRSIRLFVQQLVQAETKENIRITGPLWGKLSVSVLNGQWSRKCDHGMTSSPHRIRKASGVRKDLLKR